MLIGAIVTLNQEQAGNGGRIFALENINIVSGNWAELKVEKAVLPRINLLDAQIYKIQPVGGWLVSSRPKLNSTDLHPSRPKITHLLFTSVPRVPSVVNQKIGSLQARRE